MFSVLIMLAAGFGQMALAAALLHENIIAANPITVVAGIVRIGWPYLWPCLLAGISLAFTVLGVVGLLYKMPRMWMEAVALWAYWVFLFYLGMVSIRMMGLTYHAHAADLGWFRRRPRWATSRHHGKLYANSMIVLHNSLGTPWTASSKRSIGHASTNLSRARRDPDASIETATRRHSTGVVARDPGQSVSQIGSCAGSGASVTRPRRRH